MKTNNTFFTRFVLVLMGLIISAVCFAGVKEKLLAEAIQRGETPAGTYVIEPGPGVRVKETAMRTFLQKENNKYLKSRYSIVDIQSDAAHNLIKMEFIIKEEVRGIEKNYLYIAYKMLDGKINVNELKNTGAYYPLYYPTIAARSSEFTDKKRVVLWTGDIVDGMLHGTGYGIWTRHYRNTGDTGIFCVEGTFDYGLPVDDYREIHVDDYSYDSYYYDGTNHHWSVKLGRIKEEKFKRPTIELLEHGRDATRKGERIYPVGSPDYKNFEMALLTYYGKPEDVANKYIESAQNTLKGNCPLYLSQYVGGIRDSDEEAYNLRRTLTKIHNEQPSEKTQLCLDYMLLIDGLCLATTSDTTLAQRSKAIERNDSQYYEVLENSKAIAERFGEEDSEIGHICKEKAKVIDGWIARIKERGKFNADYRKRLEANETYNDTPVLHAEDILKMIVSKGEWKDEDNSGILEQKVTFSDGRKTKVCYSPKRARDNKYNCYGVEGILFMSWYETYEEAVVAAYWHGPYILY